MPLSDSILARIRDEVGNDTDFADVEPHDPLTQLDSLERVFEDTDRGNFSILRTAWVVWKRRLADLQQRAFDITTEGSLLNRRQKVIYMQDRIHELAIIVDETYTGRNQEVQTPAAIEQAAADSISEF
jgi:hypothetical protein